MQKKPVILIGVSVSFCAHFLKGQIKSLTQNGFEVHLICGDGEEIALLAKDEGAILYSFNFEKVFSIFTDLGNIFKLVKLIKQINPDIINAGNPKSGFLIMLAAKLIGRKNRIFTLHGLVSDTRKGLKRYLVSRIEKYSSTWAHHTIVVSHSLRAHAIARGIIKAETSFVLGNGSANGIDLSEFSRTDQLIKESKQITERLHLKKDVFTVGFVGRVTKDKGFNYLLDAFKELQKKFSLQMVVVGPFFSNDPLHESDLHELYNNPNIFYIGKVLRSAPYYPMFDVLVLPSLREGFGNVLIEAAAMEVPVIASDIPGIRDAVTKENGYLIEPNNTAQLISSVTRLINDRTLKVKLGTAGRHFVSQKFNNEKLCMSYLDFYKNLLKKGFV